MLKDLGHGIAQDVQLVGGGKSEDRSWIAFSLSVVAPRTPPQAPPPLEFTDAPLPKNYASAAYISTNSSLFRLKFLMPEDCLRLNSFAKFQA